MGKGFSITEAPIKRRKAVKLKQAQAGIDDSVMLYKKITLTSELACVEAYQVGVNALLETLAEALQVAGFDTVVGEEQFATMVEMAKMEKEVPFTASCQSSAHRQNLIDSKKAPKETWEVDGAAVISSKIAFSEGLELE